MIKRDFNNLSPAMQARLDKWQNKETPVKKENQKSPGNYVARRKEPGEDMPGFEQDKKD
jgi:hypothetical protein